MRAEPALPPTHLAALAASLLLAAAYFSQYVLGYAPCDLCHLQRYPYMAVVALGVAAHFAASPARRGILLAMAALFLADAAIAVYHSLVEWKLVSGPAQCSAASGGGLSIDALRERIMGGAVVRCDEPALLLPGISMANVNAAAAIGLAAYSLAAWRKWRTA